MPAVVISFHDGEVLHVLTPEVTFDLAVLEAEFPSIEPNSERALFPVSAIRQLLIGDPRPAPKAEEVGGWDRAAFHFVDGQVLRASIRPQAVLGRFGGVWDIVEPGDTELRTIGIPYTSLKGVYRIRQWDSRSVSERDGDARLDQLARILAERDQHAAVTGGESRPLLTRVRRPRNG
ncbi:MAG: hypothetical protein JOY80_04640 [Candidatus Dormibacteraeota bacterium]|nr:hypothetical protein [Candidatus Dormibacteraeota bacterium]